MMPMNMMNMPIPHNFNGSNPMMNYPHNPMM
jgi:hypothetical protein